MVPLKATSCARGPGASPFGATRYLGSQPGFAVGGRHRHDDAPVVYSANKSLVVSVRDETVC